MRLFLVTIFAALLLTGFAPAAPAQTTDTVSETAETPISGWAAQLDKIAERLAKPEISDFALSEIRNELEAVRGDTRRWIAINDASCQQGIEMPFPQQDVHVKELPVLSEGSAQ